jgi:Phosphoribosyl transferase domain
MCRFGKSPRTLFKPRFYNSFSGYPEGAESDILPTNEKVHLVYLRKWPNLGDMIYLQAVRSGRMAGNSPAAQTYKAMARTHARKLAKLVKDKVPAFDALVSPPSKRSDAAVYRNEIVRPAGSRDLTARFSRKGKINAADVSSVEEVVNEFDYQSAGDESDTKSLLIVDESLASGRTVVAVLDHLRRAGLSKNCIVYVAVAAWLIHSKQPPDVDSD